MSLKDANVQMVKHINHLRGVEAVQKKLKNHNYQQKYVITKATK